jgi:hypothetical protein
MATGSKKDQIEGRVKEAILPTTAHTTAATSGPGTDESKSDQSWKQNFPEAAAQGAARDEYQQTADERRVQAQLAAQKEAQRQAEVENVPVPTGENENPHSEEPAVDPTLPKADPDADSPPNREPPKV